MLILQNAGNQKKDTEILIIAPWREQHSTSFQILFYGSSSLHFPFSDWNVQQERQVSCLYEPYIPGNSD